MLIHTINFVIQKRYFNIISKYFEIPTSLTIKYHIGRFWNIIINNMLLRSVYIAYYLRVSWVHNMHIHDIIWIDNE